MRFTRISALILSSLVSFACICAVPVSERQAADAADSGFADFSDKWGDKFFDDDRVEITDNTYKSHDINLKIERYDNYGVSDRVTGDTDENREVTMADAVIISKIIFEQTPVPELSETAMLNADVNEDKTVDILDLTKVYRYLGGGLKDTDFFIEHKLVYFVADFYVRSLENFRGGFAGNAYSTDKNAVGKIADIGKACNAVFAINCDYCSYRSGGIIYRNGVMYRDNHRTDLCVITKDGVAEIMKDTDYRNLSEEDKANIWHTISFGPKMVHDGVIDTKNPGGNVAEQQPRSVFGYYEPGHYCFVLIEGRRPGYSGGLFLPDVCNLMLSLGVEEAYNMDGGSSSVMAFQGEEVNWPAWNGRKTSDILYLVETDDIVPVDPPKE